MEEQTLYSALAEFRKQLKQPMKEADNPFFHSKYVPLEAVIKSVDDAMAGTGLSWAQEIRTIDSTVQVDTKIFHDGGESMLLQGVALPIEKLTAQGVGSAITYARRYSLATAFGVASDMDDDGNQASQSVKTGGDDFSTRIRKAKTQEALTRLSGLMNEESKAKYRAELNARWKELEK